MNDRNSPVRLIQNRPPNRPNRLDRWPEFEQRARARLDAGASEYGDRSFRRGILYVIEQLKEELLDLAGWGYVGYENLSEIEEQIKALGFKGFHGESQESPPEPVSPPDDSRVVDASKTAS